MKNNNKIIFIIVFFCFFSLSFNAQTHKIYENQIDFNDLIFKIKVKTYMKIMDVPSVVACVIKNESIIWSDAFGYQNYYQRRKANLDSIYIIGSNSKVITSTAILQLYEKELIGLDDNINDYLPFNISNPNYPDVNITLRLILSHRSSLGDSLGDIIYYFKYLDNCSKWIKERLTPDGELYEQHYWKDYKPGEKSSYSNFGFIIASYLVEILSGQSFEEYCQENIFIPLEMFNTSFEKDKLNSNNFARPYYPLFSKIFIPMPHYDIGCAAPCGGLRTTVNDLSHFLIAHMNGGLYKGVRILKNSTVEEMHTVQDPDEVENFYSGALTHGLGWIHIDLFGTRWEGYNGGAIGYGCNMVIRKKDETGLILFTNGHFLRPKGPISMEISTFRFYINSQLGVLFIEKALNENNSSI